MKIINKFKSQLGIVFKFIIKIINKFKESFVYNFMSCGLGWAVIIIIAFLLIFHDFSCDRKVVKMKEDVIYIKPSTNIDDKK